MQIAASACCRANTDEYTLYIRGCEGSHRPFIATLFARYSETPISSLGGSRSGAAKCMKPVEDRRGNFRKLPADDGHWWNAYPSSRFVVRSLEKRLILGGGLGEASSPVCVIRSDPIRSSDDEDSPMATSWIAQYRDVSKSLRLSHLLPGISVGRREYRVTPGYSRRNHAWKWGCKGYPIAHIDYRY